MIKSTDKDGHMRDDHTGALTTVFRKAERCTSIFANMFIATKAAHAPGHTSLSVRSHKLVKKHTSALYNAIKVSPTHSDLLFLTKYAYVVFVFFHVSIFLGAFNHGFKLALLF